MFGLSLSSPKFTPSFPPNSTSDTCTCTSGPSAPSSVFCARAPSTSTDCRKISDEAEALSSLASPSLEVFVLRPALSGGGTASKSTLPLSRTKTGSSNAAGEPGWLASFSRVSF